MIGKLLRKIIRNLFLLFCILKENKYVQLILQKLELSTANNSVNDPIRRKKKWHQSYHIEYLLHGITSSHKGDFIV